MLGEHMLDLNKFNFRGKYDIPTQIVKNMENYVWIMGCKSDYYEGNGLLNIFLANGLVITYYSTKNFARVLEGRHEVARLGDWLQVLRFIKTQMR